MTYEQTVQWLFDALPNFQKDGGTKNYKIGLEGPMTLWEELSFPGKTIPTIHIARGPSSVKSKIQLNNSSII